MRLKILQRILQTVSEARQIRPGLLICAIHLKNCVQSFFQKRQHLANFANEVQHFQ